MRDGVDKFKDDLRQAGERNPQLLLEKFSNIGLTKLQLNIMKLRYIDGLLIKQIPDVVGVGERWVKSAHAEAIIKALDRIKDSDLAELGIHHDITAKTLYGVY